MRAQTFQIESYGLFYVFDGFLVSIALTMAAFKSRAKGVITAVWFTLENNCIMVKFFGALVLSMVGHIRFSKAMSLQFKI